MLTQPFSPVARSLDFYTERVSPPPSPDLRPLVCHPPTTLICDQYQDYMTSHQHFPTLSVHELHLLLASEIATHFQIQSIFFCNLGLVLIFNFLKSHFLTTYWIATNQVFSFCLIKSDFSTLF